MGAHVFYMWEQSRFPSNYGERVEPDVAVALTKKFAHAFEVYRDNGYFKDAITVNLNNRSWGRAYPQRGRIDLPAGGCSLGMILHEVAHLLNWKLHQGRGHTKTFKHVMIKCQVEGSHMYGKFLDEIEAEKKLNQEKFQKQMEKVTAQSIKKAEKKSYQKTRAYRIEKTVKRIARLERKAKGIATRLKGAKRSLSALQRAEAKANIVKQAPEGVGEAI